MGDLQLFLSKIRGNAHLKQSLFNRHFAADANKARVQVSKEAGGLGLGWEIRACKPLLSEDRKVVINAAKKTNQF